MPKRCLKARAKSEPHVAAIVLTDWSRLEPGDAWVFDNRRMLHARTAFDPSTGRRHLQGCYVDRDELLSRIRILERQTLSGYSGKTP
jgi:hypothetical protein